MTIVAAAAAAAVAGASPAPATAAVARVGRESTGFDGPSAYDDLNAHLVSHHLDEFSSVPRDAAPATTPRGLASRRRDEKPRGQAQGE